MEKTMDGNLAIKSVENSATHTEGSQADATRPTESSATDAGTGSEQREPEERGVLPSPEARAGAVKPAVDRVTSVGADDVSNTQAVAAAAKVPCETSSFEAATQDAAAEATDNVGNASLARTADGGSGIKQIADLNACNIAQGNGESVAAQAEVLQYSLAADACKGDEHSQVAVGAQVTSHGGSLASPPNETPSVATDIGGGRSAQTPDIAEDEKPTETDSFKVVEEALPSQEEEEEKGFRSNDGSSSPALLMEVKGSREVAEEALGTLRASFTPEKPLVQDHVTLSSSDAEGRDPVSDKGPGGIAELERSKDPIDADSSTPASAKPVAVLHPSVAYRAPVLFGPDTFILTASGNKVLWGVGEIFGKLTDNCGSIIHSGAILRGDLAPLHIGRYVSLGKGCCLTPPFRVTSNCSGYIPMTMGDYVIVGENALVSAASIGSRVIIGNNCIIGRRCILKDTCFILPGTTLPPDTVVPPLTVYGGTPGRYVADLFESAPILHRRLRGADFSADGQPAHAMGTPIYRVAAVTATKPPSLHDAYETQKPTGGDFSKTRKTPELPKQTPECRKPVWLNEEQLLPGASPLDHIPDAFFGHNYLEAHYAPGTGESHEDNHGLIDADAQSCGWHDFKVKNAATADTRRVSSLIMASHNFALRCREADLQVCFPTESLGFVPASLRVKQAEAWQRRVATEIPQWVHKCLQEGGHLRDNAWVVFGRLGNSQPIAFIPARYDWTCTSKYWGKVSVSRAVAASLGIPGKSMERNCSGSCGLSVVAEPASPQDDGEQNNPTRKTASKNRVLLARYPESEDTMGSVSSLTTASDHPNTQDNAGSPGGVGAGVELTLPTIRRTASDPPDLPLPLLKDTRLPILWLQQCEIFSDDLSDSGTNRTDARIRVMPSFWFILYRQQIRVDDVALRQIEVRFFHAFGTHDVTREVLWMEATYATLMDRYRAVSPCKPSFDASRDFSVSVPHQSFGSSPNRHSVAQFRPEFDGLIPAKDTLFRAVQFLPLYNGDAGKNTATADTTGARSPP